MHTHLRHVIPAVDSFSAVHPQSRWTLCKPTAFGIHIILYMIRPINSKPTTRRFLVDDRFGKTDAVSTREGPAYGQLSIAGKRP